MAEDQPEYRITDPRFNRGREPRNKGGQYPAEELATSDVAALFETFSRRRDAPEVRNFAIVSLMYRDGLKWADIELLYRRHYSPDEGTMTLPKRVRTPSRTVMLHHSTRDALDDWVEVRRALGIGPSSTLFCTTRKPGRGGKLWDASLRASLTAKGKALGIERRVTPEGLRVSGVSHRSQGAGRQMLEVLAGYLDEEAFRRRHPQAHEEWRSAFDLYRVNPERHAKHIGLGCRTSIDAFADDLVRETGAEVDADAGSVDRIRAALRARRSGMPKRLPAALDALVRYWGAMSDLANRQTHGARKEGEQLTREDARRLLFQLMYVMHELDRAIE